MRNPEKLKQAIADMHKSLKEDKATVSLSEKKSRELHSKIQMMTLVEEVYWDYFELQICDTYRTTGHQNMHGADGCLPVIQGKGRQGSQETRA